MKLFKWIGIVFVAIILVAVIANANDGGDEPESNAITFNSPDEDTYTTTPDQEPSVSSERQNALEAAQNYLSTMSFSKEGLIKQLRFEGYPAGDAKWAVNSVDVDWNEQAALKAEEYMDTAPFSHNGLIEQLVFEGFTRAQAQYGVAKAGM